MTGTANHVTVLKEEELDIVERIQSRSITNRQSGIIPDPVTLDMFLGKMP